MSQPALLAVAHGSRNPAAADVIKDAHPAGPAGWLRCSTSTRSLHRPCRAGAVGSRARRRRVELRHRPAAAVDRLSPDSRHHRRTRRSSAGARVAGPLRPDELLLTGADRPALGQGGVSRRCAGRRWLAAAGSSESRSTRLPMYRSRPTSWPSASASLWSGGVRGGPALARQCPRLSPSYASAPAGQWRSPATCWPPAISRISCSSSGADWVTRSGQMKKYSTARYWLSTGTLTVMGSCTACKYGRLGSE